MDHSKDQRTSDRDLEQGRRPGPTTDDDLDEDEHTRDLATWQSDTMIQRRFGGEGAGRPPPIPVEQQRAQWVSDLLIQRRFGGAGSRGPLPPSAGQRLGQGMSGLTLQRRDGGRRDDPGAAVGESQVQAIAAQGIEGSGTSLPHLDRIQAAFGDHDVTGVRAHVGGDAGRAAAAISAEAYASGGDVAFRRDPDLHTAAHEAAHVVQQRGSVQLKGGVGEVGDRYEQQADEVADRVVAGRRADDLLDRSPGGGSARTATDAAGPAHLVQQRPAGPGQVDLFDQGALERVASAERKDGPGEREHASARADFDGLPGPLKSVLQASFDWPDNWYARLPESQRRTLVDTFNRLSALGLWQHVARVTGQKDAPEAPVDLKLGPIRGRLSVAGNSGGIGFEAHDASALIRGLIATGKFGIDPWWAALLHPGQDSLREWVAEDGSLHLSVGPGNKFDAHIDKVGPVNQPDKSGRGQFDGPRSLRHHSQEVWPEMIRDVTKVPGVSVGLGPDLADMTRQRGPYDDRTPPSETRSRPGEELLGSVNIVLHPSSDQPPRTSHRPEPGTAPVDPEVMARAQARGAAAASAAELVPAGARGRPDDFADPAALASSLAMRITKAARDGNVMAQLDLGPAYASAPDRGIAAVIAAVGRIGVAVAAALPADTREVRSLRVELGAPDRVRYVSLIGA